MNQSGRLGFPWTPGRGIGRVLWEASCAPSWVFVKHIDFVLVQGLPSIPWGQRLSPWIAMLRPRLNACGYSKVFTALSFRGSAGRSIFRLTKYLSVGSSLNSMTRLVSPMSFLFCSIHGSVYSCILYSINRIFFPLSLLLLAIRTALQKLLRDARQSQISAHPPSCYCKWRAVLIVTSCFPGTAITFEINHSVSSLGVYLLFA